MKRFVLALGLVAGLWSPALAQQATMDHGAAPAHAPSARSGMGHMMGQGMMGQGMMNCPMMQNMPGRGGSAAAPHGDQGVSSLAFRAVNERMHRDMAVTFTGNADVDFVRAMIPHHQGAVDMAKVELAFGKDPKVRELAESVIKAQESEIALMKAWLAENEKK